MAQAGARRKFAYNHTSADLPNNSSHHADYHLEPKRPYTTLDEDELLDPAGAGFDSAADLMQGPMHQYRKDSFDTSSGVLSPADPHAWDSTHHGGLPVVEQSSPAGFIGQYHEDASGFVRHHSVSHVPVYAPQQPHHGSWSVPHGSGHATPAPGFEVPQPQVIEGAPYMHRSGSAHASYNHAPPSQPPTIFSGPPPPEPNFILAPQVQTPMSPHSHQDWMGMAQQERDARPVLKRMRPNSPPRTMVDFQRRDGIRKKNGRIDIPQERNIHTIDDLIEKTKDEDMLKELKQQKRLLRNREAALASRQRKKKHTEDLEGREKSYSNTMQMLEQQVADLSVERDQLLHDRQILIHRRQEADHIIDSMHLEKRDMEMRHNEETSSLRRRLMALTEQIEAGPAPMMSAAPSSTGFTDFNAEMEAMSIGHHEWDFGGFDDLTGSHSDFGYDHHAASMEQQVKSHPVVEKRASSSTIVPLPKKAVDDAQQPLASGLLFMLLLCGAFVASRPATISTSDLPITSEVRAAAPAVLSNLLQEANAGAVPTSRQNAGAPSHPQPREPFPSHHPTSGLDNLQHRLITPSKQQEIDAAFALTPAQYAALSGEDVEYDLSDHQPTTQQRTLADALVQPTAADGSQAEVWTRSLLFDQIPAHVVRQFREMVRDRERRDREMAHKVES
nr:hypothetical protein B0A51_00747 [Rachicladosporium sp. CCFEE 5018]